MLSSIKPTFKPISYRIAKIFVNQNPNTLTLIGILPPIVFLTSMISHYYGIALLSLLGTGFDLVDGEVARMTKKETKFGGVLDSTLDRLSDGLLISAFGFSGIVNWTIIIGVFVSSYLISYIRSRAELAGEAKFKLNVGIMERTERTILLGIALGVFILYPDLKLLTFNPSEIVFITMFILSTITVMQRMFRAYELLKD